VAKIIGSLKLQVSSAEHRLFYRTLLQNKTHDLKEHGRE